MHFRVPMRLGASAALSLAVLAAVGCAHSDSVADRHMAEMRETISKIEAEQDRSSAKLELLDSAEDLRAPGPTKARTAAPATGPAAPTRSVQIGEDDVGREGDDPNDPNARPEIRLQGQPGAASVSRPVRGKSTRGRDRDRLSDPADDRAGSSDPPSPRSSALDPDAKKAYDAAIAQVNGKQYDRGLESLNAFLVKWPDHPYAENAMYWRGECYFAKGEYLRAAEQFEAVFARYGGGKKGPDALLKIGMCHQRLGSADRAKEYWDRLSRDFPQSDAAKKIPSERTSNEARGPQK